MRRGFILLAVLLVGATVASAAKPKKTTLTVKIIKRQYSDSSYSYEVPGHAESTSDVALNCNDDATKCSGSGSTNTEYTAPKTVSYTLTGATLSLKLPDGRIAVVNCDSKFKFNPLPGRETYGRRGCKFPLVDDVEVDFLGSNAKLFWVVSIDGKKMDSETYKIRAILH